MDFQTAAKFGSYISKEYAADFFGLIASYHDISASEAASRLNMHIKTAQDFLEGLAGMEILKKEEVYEGKRPYFRYSLKKRKITIEIDFASFHDEGNTKGRLGKKIREKKNSGAKFTSAGSGSHLSNVVIWTGDGRNMKERRINLTVPQGKFLYHLPFPGAEPMSIADIIKKAGVGSDFQSEILDITALLEEYGIIESRI